MNISLTPSLALVATTNYPHQAAWISKHTRWRFQRFGFALGDSFIGIAYGSKS